MSSAVAQKSAVTLKERLQQMIELDNDHKSNTRKFDDVHTKYTEALMTASPNELNEARTFLIALGKKSIGSYGTHCLIESLESQ